jgi:hypothetical protein
VAVEAVEVVDQARGLASPGLDVAVDAVEKVDQGHATCPSSSESARSAQHTSETRRFFTQAPLLGTSGVLEFSLLGELLVELAGDEGPKDIRLLRVKIPRASSSAALSYTHSGRSKDRKGLLAF